jgi:hypothetical protein
VGAPACACRLGGDVNAGHTIIVAGEFFKRASHTFGAMGMGSFAQPFIKRIAVHHADKTVFNRNIYLVVFG